MGQALKGRAETNAWDSCLPTEMASVGTECKVGDGGVNAGFLKSCQGLLHQFILFIDEPCRKIPLGLNGLAGPALLAALRQIYPGL